MEAVDPRLKGVRGWLLLLCLNLAVFDPVLVLVNLFMGTEAAEFDRHPELLQLSVVVGVPTIALMVFSLYAGLTLWRMAPGAVAVARRYLICLFLFSAVSLFLPGMVGVEQTREAAALNTLGVIVTTVHVAAWYLYLMFSKRVKATYMTERAEKNRQQG